VGGVYFVVASYVMSTFLVEHKLKSLFHKEVGFNPRLMCVPKYGRNLRDFIILRTIQHYN